MINTGIVTDVSGENLTIMFDRPEACGACHACARGSESCAKLKITMQGKAQIGDKVEVEIDDSQVVAGSALAYLVPLAGLILGMGAGYALSLLIWGKTRELLIALLGLAGVAVGFAVMRQLNPKFAKGRWQPRIISINKDSL